MYLIGMVQVYISCVAYTTVSDPFFEAKGAEACPPWVLPALGLQEGAQSAIWGRFFDRFRADPSAAIMMQVFPFFALKSLHLDEATRETKHAIH